MIALGWANIGAAVAPDAAFASVASAIILVQGGQGVAGVNTAIAVAYPISSSRFILNNGLPYSFYSGCSFHGCSS